MPWIFFIMNERINPFTYVCTSWVLSSYLLVISSVYIKPLFLFLLKRILAFSELFHFKYKFLSPNLLPLSSYEHHLVSKVKLFEERLFSLIFILFIKHLGNGYLPSAVMILLKLVSAKMETVPYVKYHHHSGCHTSVDLSMVLITVDSYSATSSLEYVLILVPVSSDSLFCPLLLIFLSLSICAF